MVHPVPGRIFKASLVEAQKKAKQVQARDNRVAIKVRELTKVEALGESIFGKTDAVVKKTANFNELPPFQKELVGSMVNLDELRRALHSVGWAGAKVLELSNEYRRKMRGKSDMGELTRLRKQFESRAESIMAGVEGDVEIINTSAKTLRKMPSVRKMKTVLIAGYPNVGKSSILNRLSESKVDVQPYPFTTKQLLVGYMREGYRRYQLIDTPGILDREARNPIEKQAATALKHLSKKVMFVIDPSESCGYTLKQQEELLERIRGKINADVLIVYSKADLKTHEGISVSISDMGSIEALKQAIIAWFEENP